MTTGLGAADEGPPRGPLRPSALDQAFLEVEQSGKPPLHIGFAVEMDGPAPSTPLLRAAFADAVAAVPALSRRLVRDPLTGALRWIDDAWFDAGAHIDGFDVPALSEGHTIDLLINELFAQRLPRDRPLWRLQSMTDGEHTLIGGQLHHVIADGTGAVEIALALIGAILSPGGTPRAVPLPDASPLEGVRSELAGMQRALGDLGVFSDLAATMQMLTARMTGSAGPSWDGPRLIARSAVPLGSLREGVRAAGGTLTAALVVAAARALQELGTVDLHGSSAFVPLNARPPAGDDASGTAGAANPLGAIYVPIPQTADRKLALRAASAQLKAQRSTAHQLSSLVQRADDLPSAVRGGLTRQLAPYVLPPLIVSSVPGPPQAIELFGRAVTGAWGWAPSPAGQPAALTAISYAGQLHLTLVGDAEALVDAHRTLAAIEHELDHYRV